MWERIIHSLRDLSSRRRELDVLLFKGTPETRRYTLRNGLNQKADYTACNSFPPYFPVASPVTSRSGAFTSVYVEKTSTGHLSSKRRGRICSS